MNRAFEASEWRTYRTQLCARKVGHHSKRICVRDGSHSDAPKGFEAKWPIAALDRLEIEPLFPRLSALRWAILPQTSKARFIGPDPSGPVSPGGLVTQFAKGMDDPAHDGILQAVEAGLCLAADTYHVFFAHHRQVL